MNTTRRAFVGGASATAALLSSGMVFASDAEIKLGHTNPYSGPASANGVIGKAIAAYWRMVNDKGGINGRKVNFISLDDGYSPPKTLEAVRKLVEQEEVLCVFNTFGTMPNIAIRKYMNEKKVPQLFVASGASKWGNPKEFPWTMGYQPDYHTEAVIYAKHILANVADPKIAVLMQDDDYGKEYYEGLRDGLGNDVSKIVKQVTYQVTDPNVESQISQLKDTRANVFFNIATPNFASQAIRKAADIGWKPAQYLNNVSSSLATVMNSAGFQNCQGIITAAYLMDSTDKQWDNHGDMKAWREWMAKYNSGADTSDARNVYACSVAFMMHYVLDKCGNELTRENVMKQATNLKNVNVPMVLPGIKINTGPTDFYPIQSVRLQRFKGEAWELFGNVISAESS